MNKQGMMLEYGLNRSCPGIFCFSTTRHGGVSTGNYASLNCTPYTGDDPDSVRRNQERLLNLLPQRPQALIIPWQTHGTRVLTIDSGFLSAGEEQRHALLQGVDALVTDLPGICLCISTADCIPVLLYDKKHQAIAAVHAGWRGTVNFIIGHALERMRILYGTDGAASLWSALPASRRNGISTCGRPTACNCWISACRPQPSRRQASVPIRSAKISSPPDGWASSLDGCCRESC